MSAQQELYGRELVQSDERGVQYAGEWYEQLREFDTVSENGVIVGYSDDPLDGIRPVRLSEFSLTENVALVGDGVQHSGMKYTIAQQLASRDGTMCFVGTYQDTIQFLRSIPESRTDDVVWVGPDKAHFNMFEQFDDGLDPQFDSGVLSEVLSRVLAPTGSMGSVMGMIVNHVCDEVYGRNDVDLDMVVQEVLEGDTDLSFNLDQFDRQSIDPFLRRLQSLTMSEMSSVIANPDGESLFDAVQNDSIIVCPVTRPSNPFQDTELTILLTAFLQTVWRAMRVHNGHQDSDTPFSIVFADQSVLDTVPKSVEKWLQEDFNSEVACVTQAPHPMDLHTKTRASLFVQSYNLFSFAVSDMTSGNTISGQLGDVGRKRLMRLDTDEWVAVILNRYGETVEMEGTAFKQPRVDKQRNPFKNLPITNPQTKTE